MISWRSQDPVDRFARFIFLNGRYLIVYYKYDPFPRSLKGRNCHGDQFWDKIAYTTFICRTRTGIPKRIGIIRISVFSNDDRSTVYKNLVNVGRVVPEITRLQLLGLTFRRYAKSTKLGNFSAAGVPLSTSLRPKSSRLSPNSLMGC